MTRVAFRPGRPRARQRGVAALLVTLGLLFAMTLIAGLAHRNHVFELRSSANQLRAAQAFEAAEAGVEWAIARLNRHDPLDDDCLPAAVGGESFRERFLAIDAASGLIAARAVSPVSGSPGLPAACVRQGGAWQCRCPAPSSPAAASPPAPPVDGPAFVVRFAAGVRPHTVRLLATGCSEAAGDCRPGSTTVAQAQAQVEVLLGKLPGLATLPHAALTVRGAVQATGALVVANLDPASGGLTVHAGGPVDAPLLRPRTAGGASPAASVVAADPSLPAITDARFFASTFGLDPLLWREQPEVVRLACHGECSAALLQALQQAPGAPPRQRVVVLDGPARFSAPLEIGTPQRPVVVVGSGDVELVGGVRLHGVLHAASLQWRVGGGGIPSLQGAALSPGDFHGDAAAELVRDAAVLSRLRAETGSFARVPGGWKDY